MHFWRVPLRPSEQLRGETSALEAEADVGRMRFQGRNADTKALKTNSAYPDRYAADLCRGFSSFSRLGLCFPGGSASCV